MQSDKSPIALLVLSKSRASGNTIFPTSQSDGKGYLSTEHVVQLTCFSICGCQTALSQQGCFCVWSKGPWLFFLGMSETRKLEERKTCKCVLLFLLHFEWVLRGALLWADALQFPASAVLFLPMISTLSPGWCCCLSKCTQKMTGQMPLGACARAAWTIFLWTASKTNVHSAFFCRKVLEPLKSLSQSATNLFIVCPHPLISS